MFTGLVEEIGRVRSVATDGDGVRVVIDAELVLDDSRHGDSISVSGVCLTVVDHTESGFTADVMQQTLDVTSFASLAAGTAVNLERAMSAGARLGGHIVQGHVDGTGTVLEVRPGDQWRVIRVSLPHKLAALIVDKGSVTVDGVSLTVSDVSAPEATEPWLEVSLIPETLQATTLGELVAGATVNLETDIVARHVERMLAVQRAHPARETAQVETTPGHPSGATSIIEGHGIEGNPV